MPSSKNLPRQDALGGQSQVARIMGRAEEELNEAQPRYGKGKPGHAGRIGIDSAGRHKLTADVAPGRREQIETMSQELGLSKSDIVDAALAAMWTAFQAGQIDLDEFKIWVANENQPSKGNWKLNLPDKFSFFS